MRRLQNLSDIAATRQRAACFAGKTAVSGALPSRRYWVLKEPPIYANFNRITIRTRLFFWPVDFGTGDFMLLPFIDGG